MYGQKRPVWQWVVIYLCLGAVIYAGIYYFFIANKGASNNNQSPTQQPTPQEATQTSQVTQQVQNKITLTADGFSPATLTIKSGTTVTWINKSGKTATVDSNPHPVHTSYNPLNLGNFFDNETHSLTFNEPGTYRYHNHLNPQDKGVIIVE